MKYKVVPGILISSLLLGANSSVVFADSQDQPIAYAKYKIDNEQDIMKVPDKFIVNNNLSVEYFNYLLEKAMEEEKKQTLIITIDTTPDMYEAVKQIYATLPNAVEFHSAYFRKDQLLSLYNDATAAYSVHSIENYFNLASYKVNRNSPNLKLIDNSSKKYSANVINVALEEYTNILAQLLKGESENESLSNLYNYIFDNFTYTASGTHTMYVGNIGQGAMACNGISRLANEVLNKMGIQSEIRHGTSHFWNVVYLEGEDGELIPTTFDVTSDIVLEKRYKTLGNSTSEHIINTSNIGFYTAKYNYKYKQVNHLDIFRINKMM